MEKTSLSSRITEIVSLTLLAFVIGFFLGEKRGQRRLSGRIDQMVRDKTKQVLSKKTADEIYGKIVSSIASVRTFDLKGNLIHHQTLGYEQKYDEKGNLIYYRKQGQEPMLFEYDINNVLIHECTMGNGSYKTGHYCTLPEPYNSNDK